MRLEALDISSACGGRVFTESENNMMAELLPYWLAALYLPETGPRSIQRWLEKFDNDIKNVFEASHVALREAGLSDVQVQAVREPDWRSVEGDLRWMEGEQHHILTLADMRYPPLLKEISDPPCVLFVLGDPAVLSRPQMAMVGSRHPTPDGLQLAAQFAGALVEAGCVITSGLALGIDGASHRGALAANGLTIGVMGTGLSKIYPSSHRALAHEIVRKRGAVISEFPLTMSAHPSNFPRRNRLIAGLSLGVLVVEAAIKSGSLITARYALEQGREVFAIPGSIHQPLSRGCHHLIRQGAKLVETAQDVIEEVGALHQICQKLPESVQVPALSGNQRIIYDHVGREMTPVDVILLRSELTAGEVSSILLLLELDGYIQSVPGGYKRNEANL